MFTETELKEELQVIIDKLADKEGRWQFYPKQHKVTEEALHKFKAILNELKSKRLIQIKKDFLTDLNDGGEGHLIIVTPEGYVYSKSQIQLPE